MMVPVRPNPACPPPTQPPATSAATTKPDQRPVRNRRTHAQTHNQQDNDRTLREDTGREMMNRHALASEFRVSTHTSTQPTTTMSHPPKAHHTTPPEIDQARTMQCTTATLSGSAFSHDAILLVILNSISSGGAV